VKGAASDAAVAAKKTETISIVAKEVTAEPHILPDIELECSLTSLPPTPRILFHYFIDGRNQHSKMSQSLLQMLTELGLKYY
jgi:hypothetical protein